MSKATAIHDAKPGSNRLRARCKERKPCTSNRCWHAGQRKRNAKAIAAAWLRTKMGSAKTISHGQPETKTTIMPRKTTASQQLDHTMSYDFAYRLRLIGRSIANMTGLTRLDHVLQSISKR